MKTQPKTPAHETGVAEALTESLKLVHVCRLRVMSRDRGLPRKEQAVLVRKLFRRLGLNAISVRTRSYSMAQAVNVRLPRRQDHDRECWPHHHDEHCCGAGVENGHHEFNRCPACREHAENVLAVQGILARALPKHDDRSVE